MDDNLGCPHLRKPSCHVSSVLWHLFPLNPSTFFISFLERSFLSAYLSPILVLSIGPSYVLSWHPFLSASLCQLIAVSLHLFSTRVSWSLSSFLVHSTSFCFYQLPTSPTDSSQTPCDTVEITDWLTTHVESLMKYCLTHFVTPIVFIVTCVFFLRSCDSILFFLGWWVMVQIFVDFRWKCEDNHSRNCRCDYLASVFASCFPIVSDKINGILGFSSHFPKQMLHFPSPKRAHPMDEFRKPGQKVQHLHSSAGPGPSSGNWIYPNPGPGHQSHQSRHPETVEGGRQKERKTAHRMKKPGFSWRWFVSFSQYPMGNPLREFFCGIVFLFFFVSGVLRISKSKETHGNKKTAMSSHADSWFLLIWDRHRPKCRLNDPSGSARSPSSCAAIVRHRER